MRRAALMAVLVTLPTIFDASSATALTSPTSFTLHLGCGGDVAFDVVVPSDDSYAGLVEGLRSIGVLKGVDMDRDGTPEFLVPGFTSSELTICSASGELEDGTRLDFTAYVLFTPRRDP